ncbi:MAG: hypothetical protein HGA66_10970, partial [Holophaga sp.]|nr:hypothetical protein [Holophaga sp.]
LGGLLLNLALEGDPPQTPAGYAVVDWQEAVAARPTDAEALAGLAYAYQQEGRNRTLSLALVRLLLGHRWCVLAVILSFSLR